MVYPRIEDPPMYQWNITSETSRYDYPKAWPSLSQLRIEFSILAVINAFVSTSIFFLVVALLRSQRVREASPFNRYLVFIAAPDFMVSFFCFLTCALSAPKSEFYSEWMCGFQSFYLNFGFIANAWLNGVIVYQIHKMLRFSNVRRRYKPPSSQEITMHAMGVYVYALFWGFLCGFNIRFLPHSSHLYYGFACMPMEYSTASTIFFWVVYLPMSLVLPLFFAAYVFWDILRRNLLPATGKRRQISMFLLRLCCLYFAIWFPFVVLFVVGNFVRVNPLFHWIAAVLSHLQGMISVMFCLTNKTIQRAYYLTITCQPISREEEDTTRGSSLDVTGVDERNTSRDSKGSSSFLNLIWNSSKSIHNLVWEYPAPSHELKTKVPNQQEQEEGQEENILQEMAIAASMLEEDLGEKEQMPHDIA